MTSPQARSFLGRHSSKFVLGVLALGGTYLYSARAPPKPKGTVEPNPLQTPGVQNIEAAYQRGGATSTHTKAYGGTTLGQTDDIARDNAGTGIPKGLGDKSRGIGDEQRSDAQTKGKLGEKFDEMNYGTKAGK